jgi:hypothetical protein
MIAVHRGDVRTAAAIEAERHGGASGGPRTISDARAGGTSIRDEARFVSEVHSGHVVLATVLCHRWVARAGAHPQFGRLGERGVPVHAIVVGGIEDDEFVIYDPWSGPLRIDVDTFLHLEFGFWSGQAYAF